MVLFSLIDIDSTIEDLNDIINLYKSKLDNNFKLKNTLLFFLREHLNETITILENNYYEYVIKNKSIKKKIDDYEKDIMLRNSVMKDVFPILMLYSLNYCQRVDDESIFNFDSSCQDIIIR